jgi:hypothetical protein
MPARKIGEITFVLSFGPLPLRHARPGWRGTVLLNILFGGRLFSLYFSSAMAKVGI